MEVNKAIWQNAVKSIVVSIWIYTIAGILGDIANFIDALFFDANWLEKVQMLINGDFFDDLSAFDVIGWLCTFGLLVGYYLFYSSIKRFAEIQANENDRDSVDKIKSSYTLLIISAFADIVPLFGKLIAFILVIVAYSKQREAYRLLSLSSSFCGKSVQGMLLLRKCAGWILASVFISWIPMIGGFAESLILLITFFMILKGWKMVGENEILPAESDPDRNSADFLAIKSDDELKEIILNCQASDDALVSLARNELLERTLNHRRQRTDEEIAAEHAERERQRIEEEKRLQAEREVQERLRQEQAEQLLRKCNKLIKQAAPFAAAGLVLIIVLCVITWYNTPEKCIERGLNAYNRGKLEKAAKLILKAETKGYNIASWEALYSIYSEEKAFTSEKLKYMELLAKEGVPYYSLMWGLHLAASGSTSDEYLPYLRFGERDSNGSRMEHGRASFLIGNDLYRSGKIYDAYQMWTKSAGLGCKEANVRIADYILCHQYSDRRRYSEALEYYKQGPPDMPGVKEKIATLEEILKSNPTEWKSIYYQGYFADVYKPGKKTWGCMEYSNNVGHIFGEFVYSNHDWGMHGLPHFNGISCFRNNDGTYNIFVGEVTYENRYIFDGQAVTTYSDGQIRKNTRWYPAERVW